ncbi:hypothetical protein [Microbacterium maritypicum]
MTALRASSTYLLAPHTTEPGKRCRGWIVGNADMLPTPPPDTDHTP